MASISKVTDKSGKHTGYRIRACVGRERDKQVWRTTTIPRPEGLTPKREEKEVRRIADEWEAARRGEYEQRRTREDKSKTTLAGFVESHWWPDFVCDGSRKPSTVEFYRHMKDGLIGYFGERVRLNQLDGEAIRRYVVFLQTEARTYEGKSYSPQTTQHFFKTLRNVLDYARRMRYIKENPCNDLAERDKPHRNGPKKIDFLDVAEARRFLDALNGEPLFWRTMMNILVYCGLRRGEAVALQWGDVDLDKMTLRIRRNVTAVGGEITVGTPKTGRERTVPLTGAVSGLLEQMRNEQGEQMKITPEDWVFFSEPGKPIRPDTVTRWQRRFTERHGLPQVSPHDLRHTAATLSIEGEATLKQVQELLGHADAQTSLNFYITATESAQRETAAALERVLAGE